MTVKVGDEVRVFSVNGKRAGQPEGGWVGEVTRVGRKLIDIKYPGAYAHSGVETFRLDGQKTNDEYAHESFQTMEQFAQSERKSTAQAALRDAGLELETRARSRLTLEQLEALAEVVTTHPAFTGKTERFQLRTSTDWLRIVDTERDDDVVFRVTPAEMVLANAQLAKLNGVEA
jgi:hypothetical protein